MRGLSFPLPLSLKTTKNKGATQQRQVRQWLTGDPRVISGESLKERILKKKSYKQTPQKYRWADINTK